MKITRITLQDDLETLVEEINASSWADDNEMPRYDAASLTAYLQRQDTVFVACHDSEPSAILLGIASCRLEIRPYDQELWLYVDEVDVCADQRQRGVGRRIMTIRIELADQSGPLDPDQDGNCLDFHQVDHGGPGGPKSNDSRLL